MHQNIHQKLLRIRCTVVEPEQMLRSTESSELRLVQKLLEKVAPLKFSPLTKPLPVIRVCAG